MKTYAPQSGDLLLFSGRGWESSGIKLATLSRWSHVAPVCRVTREQIKSLAAAHSIPHWLRDHWHTRHLLIESTTLCSTPCMILGKRIKGVQAHDPRERIKSYPGKVYVLRRNPSWARQWENDGGSEEFTRVLLFHLGTPYDREGAIVSGLHSRLLRWLLSLRAADRSSMFCSELADLALQHVGLVAPGNSGQVTPANLANKLISTGRYFAPQRIRVVRT